MLRFHAFSLNRLFLFAVLSFADLALTWVLLNFTNGQVYESNPIAGAVLGAFGWAGLAIYKFMGFAVVAGLAIFISFQRPVVSSRVLTFACSTVGGVTLYSCSLVARAVTLPM